MKMTGDVPSECDLSETLIGGLILSLGLDFGRRNQAGGRLLSAGEIQS